MNAMIRVVKAGAVLGAVAAIGRCLHWVTAGSFDAVSQQDLGSLAASTTGAVAWTAYGWLLLAVVATVLEQLPGALGRFAGALARRITSTGSRALLRSTLGIAAVTPLTLGVAAHAAPADDPLWTAVERASSVSLSLPAEQPGTTYRGVEPPSRVSLDPSTQRATRQTVQPSTRRGIPDRRIAVPDRPTIGAPTRYTEIHRDPRQQVVVRPGDSLWSITSTELGPGATDAAVAARWPDWYAANTSVIGPDPDHLEPGQVLRMPSTHQEK